MFLKSRLLLRLGSQNNVMRNQFYSAQKAIETDSSDPITISDNCVQKLKQLCSSGDFLRISVEGGGCSGFQYKFDLDSKLEKDDRIFKKDGAQVVIDETSLEYVKGSTVDYHTELIRSAFRIMQNPNADVGCSCGASFAIKIE